MYRFLRNEKVAIPAAMAFVVLGFGLLAFALAIPHLPAIQGDLGKEKSDFIRGFAIGLSIAFEIAGFGALLPALAAKRKGSSADARSTRP